MPVPIYTEEVSYKVMTCDLYRPSKHVGPMFGRRRRQWANIGPTLGGCVVFVGEGVSYKVMTRDLYKRVSHTVITSDLYRRGEL